MTWFKYHNEDVLKYYVEVSIYPWHHNWLTDEELINMQAPTCGDRGEYGNDPKARLSAALKTIWLSEEDHEAAVAAAAVEVVDPDMTAVNFIDENKSTANSAWWALKMSSNPLQKGVRSESEQVNLFLEKHPNVEKVYGNVMGDFSISHPLKSLIWYPNHEYNTLELRGQRLADTLEWLAVTPRMGVSVFENEPLHFKNLQVVDIQSNILPHTCNILLAHAPRLRYVSLCGSDEQGQPGDVIVVSQSQIEVLHCYDGNWRIEGGALQSIRELGLRCNCQIEGTMPNVYKLHVVYPGYGKSHIIESSDPHLVKTAADNTTLGSATSRDQRVFPNLTHLRLQHFNDYHEVHAFLHGPFVNMPVLSSLQIHWCYGFEYDKEERETVAASNRLMIGQLLADIIDARDGNLKLEIDSDWSMNRKGWLDGFYGFGFRKEGQWGLVSFDPMF